VFGTFGFWFIGFETSRRSIEQIDEALRRPTQQVQLRILPATDRKYSAGRLDNHRVPAGN
jgi:hypothetical protein